MKKFREYISEEVVPSALVANGAIDIDNEDVRASINLALAKVTADGAITPYIALNRISKALSYFHIILPKRIYLEGAKGVEVHEIRQFGHKMGMTDQGEFVHEVPGKYYLFMQYGMNTSMNYGGQLAYPNMGGTFRVIAKVVDQIELDRLMSMAELSIAEECDAEMQQKRAKMLAPHETMHDVTSDEKKKGNKEDIKEGRMPASVIKHKQKLANMTPEEKAKKFAGKSEKQLKSMARRHGYGKDSNEYSKHVKEDKDPCWKGYEMIGMKKKRGREVPNCVPVKEEQIDELWEPITGNAKKGSSERKRKAVQMALGRKHKGEEGWNDKGNLAWSSLRMGRKLQKKGVVREEEQIDESLGRDMKKYKFWHGNPRGMKDRLKKAGPEFTKKVANDDSKHGGAAELQRRIAKKMTREETQINEKAPPGAKYERMVKHIKAGYAKDGLTKKEKSIAFATAWKAKNRQDEELKFDPSTEIPRNS